MCGIGVCAVWACSLCAWCGVFVVCVCVGVEFECEEFLCM